MKTLITGGAGFIGSTIVGACEDARIETVVLDDLSTGRREFVRGRSFYEGDIADSRLIDRIFGEHPDISSVVHCAAKVIVPESVRTPIDYYHNNVAKTIDLVGALLRNGCQRFVFSSSASIYAPGIDFAVDESSAVEPQSPYAASKWMVERILADAVIAEPLRVLSLRYFNPVGADPQLRTGLQNPAPTHALGKLLEAYETGQPFAITGVDWPTRDGSGIRDYIHVWDLARAHVIALQGFDGLLPGERGYEVINLGTGVGVTVRELVTAFETVVGCDLNIVKAQRRAGDVVGCFTRTEKAHRLLGWTAAKSLEQAARDSLNWSRRRRDMLGF